MPCWRASLSTDSSKAMAGHGMTDSTNDSVACPEQEQRVRWPVQEFHPGRGDRGVAGQPPTVSTPNSTRPLHWPSLPTSILPPPAPQVDLPPAFQELPRPSSLQPTMVLRQESETGSQTRQPPLSPRVPPRPMRRLGWKVPQAPYRRPVLS